MVKQYYKFLKIFFSFLKTDNLFKITLPTLTQYFCKWVFINKKYERGIQFFFYVLIYLNYFVKK